MRINDRSSGCKVYTATWTNPNNILKRHHKIKVVAKTNDLSWNLALVRCVDVALGTYDGLLRRADNLK
jgi:hypothetical protein